MDGYPRRPGTVVEAGPPSRSDTSSYVGTFTGELIVLVHYYLPYVVLTSYVSMRAIKPDQMRAARSLGAKRIEAFWSVYAPQAISAYWLVRSSSLSSRPPCSPFRRLSAEPARLECRCSWLNRP